LVWRNLADRLGVVPRGGAHSVEVRRVRASARSPWVTVSGLIDVWRSVRNPLCCLLVPGLLAVAYVVIAPRPFGAYGFDFRGTLWEPAQAILDGRGPYPPVDVAAMATGNPAVYPPLFMLVVTPLAMVPWSAALIVWLAILVGAFALALLMVGVRDWRCFALAVASPAVLHGLVLGNLTILLVLPLAIAWRYRERAAVVGLAVAVAVSAKLFLWPLVVWLLLTRRLRAAALSVGATAILVVVPWAVIGFSGLREYPALLSLLKDTYATHSFSLATAVTALGARETAAVAICAAAGIALIGIGALTSRRQDGDRSAFTLVVAAAIVGSPVLWHNYLALLFVPIAIARPRFGPIWLSGYAVWLVGALPALGASGARCCAGEGGAGPASAFEIDSPYAIRALGTVLAALAIAALLVRWTRGDRRPLFSTGVAGWMPLRSSLRGIGRG
jgi:hypothetical protein